MKVKDMGISPELQRRLDKAFDICDQFEADLSRAKDYNKCFAELMRDIMRKYKVNDGGCMVLIRNKAHFSDVTGLGPSTYDRIKRGTESYMPSLPTFMTLCIIYNLDVSMALTLRESFGYGFNKTDRLHQAYCYLLVNCRGKSISYCNKVLKSLKIDKKYFLGDRTIDKFALLDEM